jgi:hypothetical protein
LLGLGLLATAALGRLISGARRGADCRSGTPPSATKPA